MSCAHAVGSSINGIALASGFTSTSIQYFDVRAKVPSTNIDLFSDKHRFMRCSADRERKAWKKLKTANVRREKRDNANWVVDSWCACLPQSENERKKIACHYVADDPSKTGALTKPVELMKCMRKQEKDRKPGRHPTPDPSKQQQAVELFVLRSANSARKFESVQDLARYLW